MSSSNHEDKNETSRFLGEGVSFKAKLIGILEVSEARGDRMCQEALADLKMAIRAAGEHKQRITINIAIDGLRLRDEKTGDSLYHHPVHKISFIAQDMSDSRAFGYIFGSPDTGHRFFGIKTDKAASQVVIAMRDLFQVVFALKKKEIELAKQHLDKSRYTNTSMFSESAQAAAKLQSSTQDTLTKTTQAKGTNTDEECKPTGAAVADLVDLELELNNLQQGLTQMERITPSDPFGSKDDPFGDSFISYPKPILPPPPSGRDRTRVSSETKSTESYDSGEISFFKETKTGSSKIFDFQPDFNDATTKSSDWFAAPSVGEPPPQPSTAPSVDQHEAKKMEILSQFDVFTELDPLGTGKIKPYVDKKHFFQELKNPPKKVLNDLVITQEPPPNTTASLFYNKAENVFDSDPFGEDPFKEDPFAETDFLKQDPFNTDNCIVSGERTAVGLFNNMKAAQNFGFQLGQKKSDGSLEMNAEETPAPTPPPRPLPGGFVQIDPPPLPPKKVNKPPPSRPPHQDEVRFEVGDSGQSSLEISRTTELSPPLPVPQRRPKLEWPPPKQQQGGTTSDEDYLTPISMEPPKNDVVFNTEDSSNKKDEDLDGLDITLSQLTLSGLNELAMKLNIPASQLSNMTLVQLTSYLSNFIKNKRKLAKETESTEPSQTFKADFAANFGTTTTDQYDRYAAFRDLFKVEAPPTTAHASIVAEPPEKDENVTVERKINNTDDISAMSKEDRYAALREIVELEFKEGGDGDKVEIENLKNNEEVLLENETNIFKTGKELEEGDDGAGDVVVIEYGSTLNIVEEAANETEVLKSPVVGDLQKNPHPTSGSLSDVISGSSPEVDNTGSNSEIGKKNADAAGESWAIFDQANLQEEENNNKPIAIQSEEGVSPWSSDSKEFGNASPPGWRHRQDSSSCGEHHYRRRANRDQETWWDTAAEPEVNYYPNRHSTDSYEDESFNYYDQPQRHHKRQIGWRLESGSGGGGGGGGSGGGGGGGHSSSSRDVSPLDEEQQTRREMQSSWRRHQEAFGRRRDRRRTDSWDEDDDFEYEEEHARPHWPEHYRRDVERDRHTASSRDHEPERDDERKYRSSRRREADRSKCCCPDRIMEFQQGVRYGSGRFSAPQRHEKKLQQQQQQHEEHHYYSRDSQESLWDDEYGMERDDPYLHYATTAKRNWKRPSSASEMERKAAERSRQPYLAAGGSDGERDRKYKSGRRSRSRDSQYSDTTYNRPGPPLRRPKHPHKPYESFPIETNKKDVPVAQKKIKEHLKLRQESLPATLPRKSPTSRAATFEISDFTTATEVERQGKKRFTFEGDFVEKPEQKSLFEDDFIPTESGGICSIKEEGGEEDGGGIVVEKKHAQKQRAFAKSHRFNVDMNLKKSESVNIFARENDPFDDDFFSEGACGDFRGRMSGRGEQKWSENFDDEL